MTRPAAGRGGDHASLPGGPLPHLAAGYKPPAARLRCQAPPARKPLRNAKMETPEPSPDFPAEMFPELAPSLPPAPPVEPGGAPLSQVAPGVWVSGMPALETPSHILCRLVEIPESPGTYRLEPEPWPGFVRMGDDIGQRLGVLGLSDTTMRRLLAAGFVDHIRPAPGCIFVSVESLLAHFRRTANDCEAETSFWTARRCTAWRDVIDGTSNFEK